MEDKNVRFRFEAVSELPTVEQQLLTLIELSQKQEQVIKQQAASLQNSVSQQEASLDRLNRAWKEAGNSITTVKDASAQQTARVKADEERQTAIIKAEAQKQVAEIKSTEAQKTAAAKAGAAERDAAARASANEQSALARSLASQALAELKAALNQQTIAVKAEQEQQTAIIRGEQTRQTLALKGELREQATAIRQQSDVLREFRTLVAAYFGVHEVIDFGKSVIEAKTKLDTFHMGLTQMIGSKAEANKVYQDVIELAKTTPFKIESLTETTFMLKGLGVETKELIPTLNMLGNMAAVVGEDRLPRIAKAFTDVQSKGKLMKQELNQFAENGVPLYDLLAESMKKPREEILKMAEAHTITFDMVKKALFDASEVGGRYYNLMALQSQTLGGQIANLSDKYFIAKARIGDFYEDTIKSGIKTLNQLIDTTIGSEKAIERTVAYIKAAATAYISWQAATRAQEVATKALAVAQTAWNGLTTAGTLATGTYRLAVIAITGTTEGFTRAQLASAVAARSLWAALAANPIGAIVAVVGLAATALMTLDAATVEVTQSMSEQEFQVRKEQSELNRLTEAAMAARTGTVRRKEAIDQLVAKYPEYFTGINSEKVTNEQLKGILDKVNDSFKTRIALAKESYIAEKNADKQRALWDEEAESIARLVKKMPELKQYGNDSAAIIKHLEKSYHDYHSSVSKTLQPHGLATIMSAEWMKAGAEVLRTNQQSQKQLEEEQKASDTRIANAKKSAQDAQVAQVKDFYERQIKESAGNKSRIEQLKKEEADKIAEITENSQKKVGKIQADGAETTKKHISQTEIEIMQIKAKAGEKTLEDQLRLLELEQKQRIDNIQKLELSEKEKARRIQKVISETQPQIDALKADLQIKSVSATNIAIEKLEAQSGELRLKQQIDLLKKQEQAEIEAVNKSSKLVTQKQDEITAIINKYAPQHRELQLKLEDEKFKDLMAKQLEHDEKVKVLTVQRLEAEKILEKAGVAKTHEERLVLLQEYGKKASDEIKAQAVEQLRINYEQSQEYFDQVRLTSEKSSAEYKKALDQRNQDQLKYEQARTQLETATATKTVELINQTEQKVKEIRQRNAELEREGIEKNRQFREHALKSILDLFGQGNPIVAQFAGAILSAINNVDVLSGKTEQLAQNRVDQLKQTLSHLEIIQSSSLNRSQEQIEQTRVGIEKTKLDITKAQGVVDETKMKSFEATMGIFSMVAQVAKAIADAYNQMVAETYQAIADGYQRTRDVFAQMYNTMIRMNQEALQLELETFKGTYAEKEALIRSYHAEEMKYAEGRDRIEAEFATAQQIAQIQANAGTNIKKFLSEMIAAQYDKLQREEAMNIAKIERELEMQRELRDAKIEALEEEMAAFKAAKEQEIDAAKSASDAHEKILKQNLDVFKDITEQRMQAVRDELDAFKEAKNAEVQALNESLAKQKALTDQFYSDKALRMSEDDIYRKELLAAGEAREVAALEAAKQRELQRAADAGASAEEKARITIAFDKLIAEKHKEYQTAMGDKTKEISLANLQIKEEENKKIKELEADSANAISILKDQIVAKEKEAAAEQKALKEEIAKKDKETQDLIRRNQEETTAIINALKEQIAQKDREITNQMSGANSEYKEAVKAAQREIFEATKRMKVAELQAEIAILRGKRNLFNRGKIDSAIDDLNGAIGDINSLGFAKGTEFVDAENRFPNGTDTVPAWLDKGERVMTKKQNKQLGGITNEELVRRSMLIDSLKQTYPGLLGGFGPVPVMASPAELFGHDGGTTTIDLSQVENLLTGLTSELRNKKLLNVTIDKQGIATYLEGQQSQTMYLSNIMSR
ncbi:hypothetical protein GCM10027347_44740 [Larkinella harenae]